MLTNKVTKVTQGRRLPLSSTPQGRKPIHGVRHYFEARGTGATTARHMQSSPPAHPATPSSTTDVSIEHARGLVEDTPDDSRFVSQVPADEPHAPMRGGKQKRLSQSSYNQSPCLTENTSASSDFSSSANLIEGTKYGEEDMISPSPPRGDSTHRTPITNTPKPEADRFDHSGNDNQDESTVEYIPSHNGDDDSNSGEDRESNADEDEDDTSGVNQSQQPDHSSSLFDQLTSASIGGVRIYLIIRTTLS